MRSQPCCVTCCGCCEPRCSRSERVCVPLCLRCGMFAQHSVLLRKKVDVRHTLIPMADARDTVGNIMLALPLLYCAGVFCHCRSPRGQGLLLGRSKLVGFSSARPSDLELCFPRLSLTTMPSTTPSLPDMAHSSSCRSHLQVHPRRLATMGQCFSRLRRRNAADHLSAMGHLGTPESIPRRRNNLRHQRETLRHHPPTPNASRRHHGAAMAPESRSSIATAKAAAMAASKAVVSGRYLQHLPSSSSTTSTATTSMPTSRQPSRGATRSASSPPMAPRY